MLKKMIFLLFLVYILGGMAVGQTQEDSGQKPKPSIVVSLEKNKIGVNDPLKVVLWISNDSDYDLIDIKLHFSGPDFLAWAEKYYSETINSPFRLSNNIAKHTIFSKTIYTMIKPENEVNVGEFNILFAVEYQWKLREINQKSVVTIEEIIKIDILGIDNIFGIPVGLICLFLPGAIILLILSLFHVPLKIVSERDAKIIFSFISSLVVFGLLLGMRHLFHWRFLKNMTISLNISIEKLLILTISGILAGLLWGLSFIIIYLIKKTMNSNRKINGEEPYGILIKKMLKLNPKYKYGGNAVFVQEKDGTKYLGAYSAEFEGSIYLVGTFQIDRQQLEHIGISCDSLNNKKAIMKLINKIAPKKEIEIEIREPIEKPPQNGKKIYTTKHFMELKKEEGVKIFHRTQNEKRNLLELV